MFKGLLGYSCESYFCAINALGSGIWGRGEWWAFASVRSYAELSRVGAGWLHFRLCLNLNSLTVIMLYAGNICHGFLHKCMNNTHTHTFKHMFSHSAPSYTHIRVDFRITPLKCTQSTTHTHTAHISPFYSFRWIASPWQHFCICIKLH